MVQVVTIMGPPAPPGWAGLFQINKTPYMFDPPDFLRTRQWEQALVEAELDKRRFCWLDYWQPDIDAGSFGRWGW